MTTWSGALPTMTAGEKPPASEFSTMLSALGALTDAWTAYTPALTASTTNPTLGSGSTASGRYLRAGKLVMCSGIIVFGTSGTAAGSGTYRVSLPVNALSTSWTAGFAFFYDSSVTTGLLAAARPNAASTFELWPHNYTSAVTHAGPFAWAASDRIEWSLVYEAA